MLKDIETIFHDFGVDYFLIGALARDIRLSAHEDFAAKRKTNDVDFAVMMDDEEQYYKIKETLLATGHFEESSYKPYKFIYKQGLEVDILPFGDIETEERRLELSRHTILSMDMRGFREVYPFVSSVQISDDITLNVCTIEGLVILKLIANNDDPSRTKDITDIKHLLKVYFELNFTEMFSDYGDVAEKYNTTNPAYPQLVAARMLGRKISVIVAAYPETKEKLKTILNKGPVATWQAMLDGMNDE